MSTQKSGIYECMKGTYLHNAVAGIRARGEVHSVTLEAPWLLLCYWEEIRKDICS